MRRSSRRPPSRSSTTTFAEGKERNTALGVWGAIAGSGAAVGVLLGGVLTDTVGWEWIFFINVPIAVIVIVLAPVLLQESRVESDERRFDVAGAVTVTLGLVLLVYGLVGTTTHRGCLRARSGCSRRRRSCSSRSS